MTERADTTREILLPVVQATPDSLQGFGQLLGRAGSTGIASAFLDESVELRKPVQFISDDTTVLSLATVQPREPTVRWVERHYKHTQTFIPLGGRPFVLVLGRPTETEIPDPADLRAFLFDGTAGITMNIGTWHEFPFALAADTDIVVILRSETNSDLNNINNGEAEGADLDKRDLTARTNTLLRLAI